MMAKGTYAVISGHRRPRRTFARLQASGAVVVQEPPRSRTAFRD
jgi:hypothetical protein